MTPATLRKLRKRYGLRQADLAKALRTTRPTVWRWEHGYGMSSQSAMLLRLFFRDLKRRLTDKDARRSL